ncbi:MAG: iron complex outermembrane receptor protein, partial [Gammaproteobacteria bacterium]
VIVNTSVDGLELFAGYAENFAAIKDTVLERDASTLSEIEPETADNIDVGLRYTSTAFDASVTYYQIDFANRIVFLPPDTPDAGIDFLIGTNGSYLNVGGIESKGIEASLTFKLSDNMSFYTSYTNNDSTYQEIPDAVAATLNIAPGGTVFGSVEDMYVLSVDWSKDNYFAGITNKYVGERVIRYIDDPANAGMLTPQKADSYHVADLYAGISIDAGINAISSMEVRFTINNLFDESYLGGIAGQSAWIGAPRTAAVNLRFDF